MSERGPSPTPTALKVIRGNPGKRPLNDAEPQPIEGPPPMPAMSAEMQAEWDYITGQLQRMGRGMLRQSDQALLFAYCEAMAEVVYCVKQLEKCPRLIETDKGNWVQNPLVGIKNKAVQRLIALAGHFGLSPAARTRIKAEESGKKDEFEAFLKKNA